MLFLSKTILKNCLFLLKYHILAVLALGDIWNFQISSKNSFITSTAGNGLGSTNSTKEPSKLIEICETTVSKMVPEQFAVVQPISVSKIVRALCSQFVTLESL